MTEHRTWNIHTDTIFDGGPWIVRDGNSEWKKDTYKDAWELMRHLYNIKHQKDGYVIVLPNTVEFTPTPYTETVPYNVLGITMRELGNVNNIGDKGVHIALIKIES